MFAAGDNAGNSGAGGLDRTARGLKTFSPWLFQPRQPQSGVRRDATLFQNDFIDAARRHVQRPPQRVLRQATRQHKFCTENFPRMNRRQFVRHAFHGFTFNFSAVASLRWLVSNVRNSRAPKCNAVATWRTSKRRCPPVMGWRLEIVSASR